MTGEPKTRRWLQSALLILIVGATYARAVQGTFIWDDRMLVRDNPYIGDWRHLGRNLLRDFSHVHRADDDAGGLDRRLVRPLVTLSLMIDHQLYGKAPWGYHLTNLLLHLAAVLLAARLLGLLLFPNQPWLVFAAAAVFALHPTRAESVCWIAGRTDLLMATFALAALALFWRAFSDSAVVPPSPRRRALLTAGGWLCFIAALLAKETAVGLAPLVLATDWLLVARGVPPARRLLTVHGPLLLATAAYVAWRVVAQPTPPDGFELTAASRLNMVLTSTWHYGRALIVPYEPNAMIGAYFDPLRWDLLAAAVGALLLGGWAVATASAWRRAPRAAWALLLFAAMLAPALNLVPTGLPALAAERYLYLPLLGVGALLALGLAAAPQGLRRALGVTVGLLCAGALCKSRPLLLARSLPPRDRGVETDVRFG